MMALHEIKLKAIPYVKGTVELRWQVTSVRKQMNGNDKE